MSQRGAKRRCKFCPRVCVNQSNLRIHIRSVHTRVLPYSCGRCPKRFALSCLLQRHVMLTHEIHACRCRYCDETFPSRRDMIAHRRKHHGSRLMFRCALCSLSRHTRGRLQRHLHSVHYAKAEAVLPRGLFKCGFCAKQFTARESKFYHEQTLHNGVLPFQCDVCGKRFVIRAMLTKHMKRQHATAHHCQDCNKQFSLRRELLSHIRSAVHGSGIHCSTCLQRFGKMSKLKLHLLNPSSCFPHRKMQEEVNGCSFASYQCALCAFTLSTKARLRCHLHKFHYASAGANLPRELFHCSFCAKEFTTRRKKYWHEQKWHNSVLPFKCDVCDKRFVIRCLLSDHKRLHHASVHHCPDCNMQFPLRRQLAEHIRNAVRASRFWCCTCLRRFREKASLKEHLMGQISCSERLQLRIQQLKMKRAKEDKRMICPYCARVWYNRSYFDRHVTSAHRLKCKLCPLSFDSGRRRHDHMIACHMEFIQSKPTCPLCGVLLETVDLKQHFDSCILPRYPSPKQSASTVASIGLPKSLASTVPIASQDACISLRCSTTEQPIRSFPTMPANVTPIAVPATIQLQAQLNAISTNECDFCPKLLPSPFAKILHENSTHRCALCSETFVNSTAKSAHVQSVHLANKPSASIISEPIAVVKLEPKIEEHRAGITNPPLPAAMRLRQMMADFKRNNAAKLPRQGRDVKPSISDFDNSLKSIPSMRNCRAKCYGASALPAISCSPQNDDSADWSKRKIKDEIMDTD